MTERSLSTGNDAGHAAAHLPQSMQALALRRILVGLKADTKPSSAP
jgi:hypothetical protein